MGNQTNASTDLLTRKQLDDLFARLRDNYEPVVQPGVSSPSSFNQYMEQIKQLLFNDLMDAAPSTQYAEPSRERAAKPVVVLG